MCFYYKMQADLICFSLKIALTNTFLGLKKQATATVDQTECLVIFFSSQQTNFWKVHAKFTVFLSF